MVPNTFINSYEIDEWVDGWISGRAFKAPNLGRQHEIRMGVFLFFKRIIETLGNVI